MAGPVYFAWADKTETTYGPEHQVKDLQIRSLRVDHKEGNAATLAVTIKNPRSGGLLTPGRKRCAWLSVQHPVTLAFTPLIFVRLLAWPVTLSGEFVELQFTAQPRDFETQRVALAETMKDLPEYDAVFVDEKAIADPNTVLEGRAEFWHSDRVTHQVTTSDALIGEDGLEIFSATEVPYGSVDISIEQTQLRAVEIDATVKWEQAGTGVIDFPAVTIKSYTGDGLIQDWPRPGAGLQSGWSVEDSAAIDVWGIDKAVPTTFSRHWQNTQKEHINGASMEFRDSKTSTILLGTGHITGVVSDKMQVGYNNPFAEPPINIPATRQTRWTTYPLYNIVGRLSLRYESDAGRTERARIRIEANVQPLQNDPEDDETVERIAISGRDVGKPVPDGNTAGSIPIGDPDSRDAYFLTARGRLSLEHLMLRGAARLKLKARSVSMTGKIPFWRAIDLSCRKNALLPDRRVPGGHAIGKITSYAFWIDGATGEMIGSVTIGCSIGYAVAIEEAAGEPEYVDEGVLDPGIQFYTNSTIRLTAGGGVDIAYSPPTETPDGDGLMHPLTYAQAVISDTIGGNLEDQAAAILGVIEAQKRANDLRDAGGNDQLTIAAQEANATAGINAALAVLETEPIYRRIELIPITGKTFETPYNILAFLQLPMMVNLGEGEFGGSSFGGGAGSDTLGGGGGSGDTLGGGGGGDTLGGGGGTDWLVGVNLAGAEFGTNMPGTYNTDYTYPTQAEVDYYAGKGMRIVRLPFRWERLQPTANAALSSVETTRLLTLANAITAAGMICVIDPHNYDQKYNQFLAPKGPVPTADFADFWSRVATVFKTNLDVWFCLMNEPNCTGAQWLPNANAAIAAIRAAGATNKIMVPGGGWTAAMDWINNDNDTAMTGVVDSGANFVFDTHQYLDSGNTGAGNAVSGTIGSQRLQAFTNWARSHGYQAFLGEMGCHNNATDLAALDDALNFLHSNQDVWIGMAYWAGGPWWGNYALTIEPAGGVDRPQMPILQNYLAP